MGSSSNRKFGRVHIVVCCLVFASLLLILYHAAPSSRQGPVDTIDTPSQSIVISDPNNTTKPDADEKTDPPPPPPINPVNPDPHTAPPSKQDPDEPLPPTVNPDPNNVPPPPPPKQDEPDEPLPPTVITKPDITIVDPPKQLPKKPVESPPQPVVPPNNTIDDPSKQVPDEPIKAPPPPPPEPVVITTPKITFNPAAGQTYGYSVIPADTRYFTQQFVVHGLGHKWCELLLGIRFARLNNLTYVFDEKTFLYNYRQSDLTWIGDLVKRRYGKVLDDYTPEYKTEEWIHAPDFMYDAAVLYQETMKEDDKKTFKGFYSNEWTQCQNPDTGSQGCWTNGIPYYNITRDLQDILTLPEKKEIEAPKEPGNTHQSAVLENRVAIHVRLGDIRNLLTPEAYQDLIRGIEIKHQVIIPIENVHFVYYEAHPDDRNNEDDKVIRDLKKKMPKAKYHNFENTGDTVQFLAHSKFLVTSGSSLSYLAAYLCPDCQVVFVKPKEYNDDPFDETNYTNNFYYMTGWEPHFRYLSLAD